LIAEKGKKSEGLKWPAGSHAYRYRTVRPRIKAPQSMNDGIRIVMPAQAGIHV
jgi:hypothetical protein